MNSQRRYAVSRSWVRASTALGLGLALWAGCARESGIAVRDDAEPNPQGGANTRAATNPIAYIEAVAARAAALRHYRLMFYRQERLGALQPVLRKMERIEARHRAEPFSVHFRWLDDDSEYVEAAYVRGRNGDKVMLLPRRGLLGLPPAVGRFNVEDAVAFHKSRNPITDFGLARMMERTLQRIRDSERLGGAQVQYAGLRRAGRQPRAAHRYEVRFPPGDPYPNKRMVLYVDERTELPLGVYLWLPNGKLDAMYLYEQVDTSIEVADTDFEIRAPQERPRAAEGAVSPGRPSGTGANSALAKPGLPLSRE